MFVHATVGRSPSGGAGVGDCSSFFASTSRERLGDSAIAARARARHGWAPLGIPWPCAPESSHRIDKGYCPEELPAPGASTSRLSRVNG